MTNKYFFDYNFYNIESNKSFDKKNLTLINNFKSFQQTQDNTCAPACVKMILDYITDYKLNFDEMKLAKDLHTRPFPYGTKLKNIYNFFKKNENKYHYKTIASIDLVNQKKHCFNCFEDFKEFVITNLKSNSPILVENIDYGGHYKIIIGYDQSDENVENDVLIFADPYSNNENGYNYFYADRFFYMWFDDHCIEKKYRKQPFILIKKQIS